MVLGSARVFVPLTWPVFVHQAVGELVMLFSPDAVVAATRKSLGGCFAATTTAQAL